MFPKMCASTGLSFKDLLELLFAQAKFEFKERAKLCTSR
jgi:hypothetical protein